MTYKQIVEGCPAYNGELCVVYDSNRNTPCVLYWSDLINAWCDAQDYECANPTHYLPDSNVIELEREPLRMTVWEWREFPGIIFTFISEYETHKALWKDGELRSNTDDGWFYITEAILNATGTEVINRETEQTRWRTSMNEYVIHEWTDRYGDHHRLIKHGTDVEEQMQNEQGDWHVATKRHSDAVTELGKAMQLALDHKEVAR